MKKNNADPTVRRTLKSSPARRAEFRMAAWLMQTRWRIKRCSASLPIVTMPRRSALVTNGSSPLTPRVTWYPKS